MVAISESHAVAQTTIRTDSPFYVEGSGVPAYIGLEMMAQAIATIDGMKRKQNGLPAKIGFLLGCRQYAATCDVFVDGAKLTIAADMVFGDNDMFAFECKITDESGAELARANMSAYAPDDPLRFLREGGAP